MKNFLQDLRTQRWDDHRYYHHNRVNQSLHLLSALSFIAAYCWLFIDPVISALLGWLVSMTTRQAGHFFFEPHTYDEINQATHAHKEEIKVGYNLRRKVVLMALWAASPLLVVAQPSLFGMVPAYEDWWSFVRHVGMVWLVLGVAGLAARALHLMVIKDVQTALVWVVKILTDPFHDVLLYHRAPLHLLRGEIMDPMHHVRVGQ